ncbi:MAG: uracil phosphoribosyltransferase [Clostridiales bacterium]|jgi:uracil phosphoribosyltransferase|nr:uracil phosphoribosyltransferase [Clostridiales bacterium]
MNINSNLKHINHCLINHKVSLMRDKGTGTKEFREYAKEIALMLGYEALRELPTVPTKIVTPLETTTQNLIKKDSVVLLPILRAGLGMVDGILTLIPTAAVGHIGMYRDHQTFEAKEYFCKMPTLTDKTVLLLDPMLATGGSASAAVKLIKTHKPKKIKFLCIVSVPYGIEQLTKNHSDIEIYTACIDRELNADKYIVPGLGDAGDRLFGTK